MTEPIASLWRGLTSFKSHPVRTILAIAALLTAAEAAVGQDKAPPGIKEKNRPDHVVVVTDDQWTKLDLAVDRGLAYLATTQSPDGSFPTTISGQPGVTSLCVIAFLSRGHVPNEGKYGKQLLRAIDYVLDTQGPDGTLQLQRLINVPKASFEVNYNHPIAGLMLGEVYGMAPQSHQERIRIAIELGLRYARSQQLMPKRNSDEKGGWRYGRRFGVSDADLSITGWHLMFLRSARNAEFDVPKEWIDEGMNYVRKTFDPVEGAFRYGLQGEDDYVTRGMAGAGIVALALGGEHNSDIAKKAGDYILRNGFDRYNRGRSGEDRYHYGAYHCGQAMYQLGGDYWAQFFPPFLEVLTKNQQADGSWPPETVRNNARFGSAYTTALTVLALTPPYQLLPIYQR